MKNKLFLIMFSFLNCLVFTQELVDKKPTTPLYVDAIVSVSAQQGNIKELIKEISEQNKGIPAIDANILAMACNIPAITANNVRLGIFLMAFNNYYDEASETVLSVKADNQAIYIKGQKVIDKSKYLKNKSLEEYNLLTFPKNAFIKMMLEGTTLDELVDKLKIQYEITSLAYYQEKQDEIIYLYGTKVNLKLFEKILNRLDKKWVTNKNLKIIELIDLTIYEEKIESIQEKIKNTENTLLVYLTYKNNAFEKLNKEGADQKRVLSEIEDIKNQITDIKSRINMFQKQLQAQKKLKPK